MTDTQAIERARAISALQRFRDFNPSENKHWLRGVADAEEALARLFNATPRTPAPKISEKRAREVWAEELRRSAPKGEYVANTFLESPSPSDERVIRAMLALATEATTINNRLSDIDGEGAQVGFRIAGESATAEDVIALGRKMDAEDGGYPDPTADQLPSSQPAIREGMVLVPIEALVPFVSEAAVYLTGSEPDDREEGIFPTAGEIRRLRAIISPATAPGTSEGEEGARG